MSFREFVVTAVFLALTFHHAMGGFKTRIATPQGSRMIDLPLAKGVRIRQIPLQEQNEINGEPFCFRDSPPAFDQDTRVLNETCPVPTVPMELFFQQPLCRRMPCSKRETCLLVAENILAHYGRAFDMVFLTGEVCQAKLGPGNFTMEKLQNLLPVDEKLVGIQVNGTDLVEAVEQGLNTADDGVCTNNQGIPSFLRMGPTKLVDRFPIVSGIKFGAEAVVADKTSDLGAQKTIRINNVLVLSPQCQWREIDMYGSYSLLTTESLAFGKQGYSALARSYGYWSTGQTVRGAFWDHCQSTCSVNQPVSHYMTVPTKHPTASQLSPLHSSPVAAPRDVKVFKHDSDLSGTIIRLSAPEANSSSSSLGKWMRTSSSAR